MSYIKLIIIGIGIFVSSALTAQVSVQVNVGSPPMWGPAGYTEVRYYYLPDVEAYYDIKSSMFIYYSGGAWIHRAYLPSRYSNYDLYGGYKVVMVDYHGNAPHTHFKEYKVKYKKGYRGPYQKTIGAKSGNGHSSYKKQSTSPQKQQSKESHIKSNQNSSKGNSSGHKGGKGNGGGKGKKK